MLGTCAIILVGALFSASAQTALPEHISVERPSAATSRDAAAFSGAWFGSWRGELPTALVVERISSNGCAEVIYSWGDAKPYRIQAGWQRQTAKISNGKLQFAATNGASLTFGFAQSGALLGQYEWSNIPPAWTELQPLPDTNGSAILKAAKKPPGLWDEVRIPLHSQTGPTKGKSLSLQTTIYRQPRASRHPAIIFNHGSTGRGMVPASDVEHGGSTGVFLHSLGYVVVMPMRKGRGTSDGPYFEEDDSVAPAVQLESAIEDLRATVQYVRTRQDVDPKKIVLAGQSRGGLLSVAYAGRYPGDVAGVINFAGGWFGEDAPSPNYNFEIFAKAGHDADVPMLWLYADHDSFYSLKFIEREFSGFRDAGGRGELFEARDIPGNGHFLCEWVDRWRNKVTTYLNDISQEPLDGLGTEPRR